MTPRVAACAALAVFLSVGVFACASRDESMTREVSSATLVRAPFGVLPSGDSVHVYTLTNANGIEARILDYGGILVSLRTPDRAGAFADVVLGFDSLSDYVKDSPYFGALVGRYANRIARGRFTLDGASYSLAANNGMNALHGGVRGFDKVVWQGTPVQDSTGVGVVLRHESPDGDEGYPGTVQAQVTYTLTDRNELVIDYEATTDQATPINLTHHSYFNLAGAGDVLGHVLSINADRYVPIDTTLIPTGVLEPVDDSPFDLRTNVAIGAKINTPHPQLTNAKGYDHTFVLNRTGPGLSLAARVVEPVSGRTLEVATTEPGMQLYTGNFLDGSLTGKSGRVYLQRHGFCLETQHFPDSPNQPSFPSTILRPGERYRSQTVYTFAVVADSSPTAEGTPRR